MRRVWPKSTGRIAFSVFGPATTPFGFPTNALCIRAAIVLSDKLKDTTGVVGQCNGAITLDWNQYMATHPNALGSPRFVGQVIDAQAWIYDTRAQRNVYSPAVETTVGP